MVDTKKREAPNQNQTEKTATLRHAIGICVALALLLELLVESFCRHSVFSAFWFLVGNPLCFLYNSCIILTSLSLATFFRKKGFVLALISVIWLGLGIADFVLTSYRTTPLSAIDFALLKSVWSILQVYLDIWQIVLVIVLFLAIVAGLVVLYRHARKMQARRLGGLVFVSSCGVITALSSILLLSTGILSNEFYNLADAYADYGFPYCFARSIFDRGIDEPEDYSVNRVQQFLSDIHAETDSTPSKTPNIVMVQLESFFDVNYLRNLTYSENPVPVFTALKANFPHGFLTVPALGAGTANTEFEVITGMNLDYFGTGEYPYETILKKTACETIGYDLKELGYSTHAIHNNTATFYDRNLVYPNLGFDTFTSLEYMDNIETNALGWAKDAILIPAIVDALDSTAEQDFVYTVSVQGHGKYPRTLVGDNYSITLEGIADEKEAVAFWYYVNQLHEMDTFIGNLLETLGAYPEPVVVVLFGDHLPNFEISTQDLTNKDLFQTEYVIWSNFELEAENQDLRAYQLSSYVMSLFHIDNGVINKLHQRYSRSPGYLDAMEVFEYDMLYGELGTVDTPYMPTQMRMGVKPIVVTGFARILGNESDAMYVYGENFTTASVVTLGDEQQPTTFVSASCLQIPETAITPGMAVTVSQVSDDAVTLSTSPRHYITAEEAAGKGS